MVACRWTEEDALETQANKADDTSKQTVSPTHSDASPNDKWVEAGYCPGLPADGGDIVNEYQKYSHAFMDDGTIYDNTISQAQMLELQNVCSPSMTFGSEPDLPYIHRCFMWSKRLRHWQPPCHHTVFDCAVISLPHYRG